MNYFKKGDNVMGDWRVVCKEPFMNCSHIFPTQQQDVYNLIQLQKDDSRVEKIIIFGSSVTSACNPWSDIDVYFQVTESIDRFKKPKCVVPFDVWTNYDVDDRLLKEIEDTGVVVYEK